MAPWGFTTSDREYRAVLLDRPVFLLDRPVFPEVPFAGAPYACLLWDAAVQTRPARDMTEAARQLVASGCRYVVCAGHDGETWCDAVDRAFRSELPPGSEFTDRLVVAQWHYQDESPEEVGRLFVHRPDFGWSDLRNYLVLVLGADRAVADRLLTAVRDEACRGRA